MKNTENNSHAWFQERIDTLTEFMTPERREVLDKALALRTRYMTILTENTFHPQNASALVRHCEAFGIQDIHTVETLCKFNPNLRIVRGTDQWLNFHHHDSTLEAITSLKAAGYRIVATTPHRQDCTPETFDVGCGKFALVFGTEHAGISEEVVSQADEFLRIPMCGLVESLNVSASAAILIYMLSERMRAQVPDWQLTQQEQAEVLLAWMRCSVKDAALILNRKRLF